MSPQDVRSIETMVTGTMKGTCSRRYLMQEMETGYIRENIKPIKQK